MPIYGTLSIVKVLFNKSVIYLKEWHYSTSQSTHPNGSKLELLLTRSKALALECIPKVST